jgi:hypothetical protein
MSREINRNNRTEQHTLCDEKGPRKAHDLKLDIYDNQDSTVANSFSLRTWLPQSIASLSTKAAPLASPPIDT